MNRTIVRTSQAPAAIGPYSQAVVVPVGGQRMVFCSGQIALDPATGQVIEGDIAAQTRRVMAKRAAERYSTAKDMADDLRQFLTSVAQAESPSARAPAPTRTLSVGTSTDVATPTPTSDGHLIKVVPKGLRSFDARDSDFFLELLPGPRDREGLPESLRFWKTRIEERDADSTSSSVRGCCITWPIRWRGGGGCCRCCTHTASCE